LVAVLTEAKKSNDRERCLSPELGKHLDLAHDLRVEVLKPLCGDPVFSVTCGTHRLYRKVGQERSANLKPGDVSEAGFRFPCVPSACDLNRVFLIQDRIEDGLFRQPRRKLLVSKVLYEIQFFSSDGTIECHGVFHV